MFLRSFFLLLTTITKGSFAVIGPNSRLQIVNANIAPDGYSRSATLAGGTFPGPLIRGYKDSIVKINVSDELTDQSMSLGTSIHWHGLVQTNANYNDGVSFVTQCPIIPKESFQYRIATGAQAGTFWYHSHFKTQYCDGLRGPLVIYDPGDPHGHMYDKDNEDTVITLADWYHYVSSEAPTVPVFNSTLINGKGRYSGGPAVPLAVVNVVQGKRYRFRIVSISCDPSYNFSIDSHQLTVIEVDGNSVQPLVVDSIHIYAGQRYSAVVSATKKVDNYWIRSLPNATGQGYNNLTNLAILRYAGASDADPSADPTKDIPTSVLPLNETDLHPFVPTPVPGKPMVGGADININLNVTQNSAGTQFLVNNVSFSAPSVTVLLQILSGAKSPSDLLPAGSIYGLDRSKSVEITIPAGVGGGPHPVHLHGHAFHVVRSAGNSTYNFENPVIRDVVSIGNTGDNVTIRFQTNNPGPWFFHCHIDWHLNQGFAVVFAEDVADVPKKVVPPAAWEQLCPEYNSFVKTAGHT